MSIWTHVAGTIRVDALRIVEPIPDVMNPRKVLGPTNLYDEDNPKSTLPCGSEGSLNYDIWTNPEEHDMAAHTVSIFGDLRDYDNLDEIKKWFEDVVGKLMVRQAVLTASVEGGPTMILVLEDKHIVPAYIT